MVLIPPASIKVSRCRAITVSLPCERYWIEQSVAFISGFDVATYSLTVNFGILSMGDCITYGTSMILLVNDTLFTSISITESTYTFINLIPSERYKIGVMVECLESAISSEVVSESVKTLDCTTCNTNSSEDGMGTTEKIIVTAVCSTLACFIFVFMCCCCRKICKTSDDRTPRFDGRSDDQYSIIS